MCVCVHERFIDIIVKKKKRFIGVVSNVDRGQNWPTMRELFVVVVVWLAYKTILRKNEQ